MLVGEEARCVALRNYSAGAANCRTVNRDACADRTQRSAERLVDGRGLRAMPRDREEHLDGLRLEGTGPDPRTDVWPVASVASKNDQGLGSIPTSAGIGPRRNTTW